MKSKTKILVAMILVMFSGLLLRPSYSYAAGLSVCGGSEDTSSIQNFQNTSCHLKDIFGLIARVVNFLIGVAAVYAVIQIVLAGFRMVASFGNEKMYSEGRKHLTNAVIGFVLVMIAFLIVNTVFTILLPGTSPFGIQFNQTLIK